MCGIINSTIHVMHGCSHEALRCLECPLPVQLHPKFVAPPSRLAPPRVALSRLASCRPVSSSPLSWHSSALGVVMDLIWFTFS